jgi:hypothetical protein
VTSALIRGRVARSSESLKGARRESGRPKRGDTRRDEDKRRNDGKRVPPHKQRGPNAEPASVRGVERRLPASAYRGSEPSRIDDDSHYITRDGARHTPSFSRFGHHLWAVLFGGARLHFVDVARLQFQPGATCRRNVSLQELLVKRRAGISRRGPGWRVRVRCPAPAPACFPRSRHMLSPRFPCTTFGGSLHYLEALSLYPDLVEAAFLLRPPLSDRRKRRVLERRFPG